jgi:hypothetical protein
VLPAIGNRRNPAFRHLTHHFCFLLSLLHPPHPASPGDNFHEQRLRGLWEAIKPDANVNIRRWP